MLLPLNLQLFAEEVEDEELFLDDDLGEEVEELEEEIEELEEDVDLEEDLEDEKVDKKTKAIIKHKKENKELKRRLQELEDEKEADALEVERNKMIVELAREGKSSTEATKIADEKIEVKKLRLQIARLDIDKLETKYPGISLYATQLAEDKAKLPEFSYEQLYQAKYAKQSKYDEKTRLEQELLAKSKEARSKSLETGTTKNNKTIKLSQEDERVYQHLKNTNKSLTRKQFKDLLEMDEMEL